MKDSYGRFVELALRCASSWDDLVDKKLHRRHNYAMSRLYELEKAMYETDDRGAGIALRLLSHESERVRLSAGAYCILAEVHVEEGRQMLAHIYAHSNSGFLRLSASNCLDYCKPFLESQ